LEARMEGKREEIHARRGEARARYGVERLGEHPAAPRQN